MQRYKKNDYRQHDSWIMPSEIYRLEQKTGLLRSPVWM